MNCYSIQDNRCLGLDRCTAVVPVRMVSLVINTATALNWTALGIPSILNRSAPWTHALQLIKKPTPI